MARVTGLCVGESLVDSASDGKNLAHIDLILGPRGGVVESTFAQTLCSNKEGHTSALAVVAPNLAVKPNTVMFNKVTMKNLNQAVQLFGPAQRGIALAVADSVKNGIINDSEADDIFICVSVFIAPNADSNELIQENNYLATLASIENAVLGLPSSRDVQREYEGSVHPFGADKKTKITHIDVINKNIAYRKGLCNSSG
jgi:5,6,7,8-tetrahydromethanopterin hydro-lyase